MGGRDAVGGLMALTERQAAIIALLKRPDPPDIHRGHVRRLEGTRQGRRWLRRHRFMYPVRVEFEWKGEHQQ